MLNGIQGYLSIIILVFSGTGEVYIMITVVKIYACCEYTVHVCIYIV